MTIITALASFAKDRCRDSSKLLKNVLILDPSAVLDKLAIMPDIININEIKQEVNDVQLRVNDKFFSYDELEEKINEYKKSSYSLFYKRDVVTILQSRRRGVKRYIEKRLKYYYIKYCCVRGGQVKGKYKRKNSWHLNCKAMVQVKPSTDGQYLVISKLNLTHNHENPKEIYERQAKRIIKKK